MNRFGEHMADCACYFERPLATGRWAKSIAKVFCNINAMATSQWRQPRSRRARSGKLRPTAIVGHFVLAHRWAD